MSLVELVIVGLFLLVVVILVVLAAPHFVRGFRDARERRGIDLNMEHRVEQELADDRAGTEEWRQRLDDELEHKLDQWREDGPGGNRP